MWRFLLLWALVTFAVAIFLINPESLKRDRREWAKLLLAVVVGLFVAANVDYFVP